jgi:ubiquinone/menaquinone biosynthesis C-methylase UbiE
VTERPFPAGDPSVAFDILADRYDGWYDSAEGAVIFRDEVTCLQFLCPERRGRWVEIGVGTGRFASALGIVEGLDPSPKMLARAAQRGVSTHSGTAEKLPFPDGTFDGVLMALALCFVQDAGQALRECARVLRPSCPLLLGIIPSDSPWGESYKRKAAEGHAVYSLAQFRTVPETVALAESGGFVLRDSASALFGNPGAAPDWKPRVERGAVKGTGFVALRFEKR